MPGKSASRKTCSGGASGSRVRIRSAPKTVEEYLARIPQPARGTLEKVHAAIRSALPREAREVISYQIPAFRTSEVLVWFAAFTGHCSIFPTAAVIDAFRNKLKGYSLSKGTIQFPTNQALPAALVRRLVKARVAQVAGKKRR